MTDRHWQISDIASQSLATVLSQDDSRVARHRRQNETFLYNHLAAGKPIKPYGDSECPLLHSRYLSSQAERNSLRSFLMSKEIFTSIHWPAHPQLKEVQDNVDCTDAFEIADHVLAFPVSQEFGEQEMSRICDACDAWLRAGSARFGTPAA